MVEKKPLHVRVAEALGWTYLGAGESGWEGEPPRWHPKTNYARRLDQHIGVDRYDTDWSATGPLIEKYGVYLYPHDGAGPWVAQPNITDGETMPEHHFSGVTPLIAVCHLILALKDAGKLDA